MKLSTALTTHHHWYVLRCWPSSTSQSCLGPWAPATPPPGPGSVTGLGAQARHAQSPGGRPPAAASTDRLRGRPQWDSATSGAGHPAGGSAGRPPAASAGVWAVVTAARGDPQRWEKASSRTGHSTPLTRTDSDTVPTPGASPRGLHLGFRARIASQRPLLGVFETFEAKKLEKYIFWL